MTIMKYSILINRRINYLQTLQAIYHCVSKAHVETPPSENFR